MGTAAENLAATNALHPFAQPVPKGSLRPSMTAKTQTNPGAVRPSRVGLIGGTGQMGSLFASLLRRDGLEVRVAGPMEDPTYGGLVTQCEVVIVTVPISQTEAVIGRIAPHLRPEQLLSDFTSVKAAPVAAMLATPAQVIGCHPLFGPMPNPAGQNVVLCPARPGPWMDWYRDFFTRHGMTVSEMSPQAHDEAMAFIQGLTHFINIVFARTLQTREAGLKDILTVCSPVYQILFSILCRILSGNAELYGQIQISNSSNPPVLREFLANGEELLNAVNEQDTETVYRLFNEASEYLGPFRQRAREDSDFLIQQMTGRHRAGDGK